MSWTNSFPASTLIAGLMALAIMYGPTVGGVEAAEENVGIRVVNERAASAEATNSARLVPYRAPEIPNGTVFARSGAATSAARVVESPVKKQAGIPPKEAAAMIVSADGLVKVALRLASQTSEFHVTLAEPGCLSIGGSVRGRREMERIWGPEWVGSGTQIIKFPTARLTGRKGQVELFSIGMAPVEVIGRAGKGERQFIQPMGIAWDETTKHLYVADTGNDRVVKLTPDGRFVTQYGGFGVAFGDKSEEREDSLDEPWDVAVGGFSNLFVSDQNNDRISEFDAYRSYKGTFFPKGNDVRQRLNKPRGCIIDSENHLWVVDAMNDRVLKLSGTGGIMLELGGYGWSQQRFKDPTQIAVDVDGRIFVCDRGNQRLQVFDRLGGFVGEIRDHLKSPVGVAVDPDGLVWVCDEKTGEVGVYTPAGRRLCFSGADRDGVRYRSPSDLVVLKDRAYLLDAGNHRLIVFERRRTVSAVAWQGPAPMVK